jgi:large subunit ribosomal protein L6
MSRIGKMPVPVTDNVEFSINAENLVRVKGKNGELTLRVDPRIKVEKSDGNIIVTPVDENRDTRALHGLYRALIHNLVVGATEGFKKELEIIGVGFRAGMNGDILELALGFSHNFYFAPPQGVNLEVDTKSSKNPRIIVTGADKVLVGQVAAKIRSLRPPEPYKGKGIRYLNEQVRKKAGKSAGR